MNQRHLSDAVQVRWSDALGFGIHATSSMGNADVFLELHVDDVLFPQLEAIERDERLDPDTGFLLQSAGPVVMLAFTLLYERLADSKSPWKEYIDVALLPLFERPPTVLELCEPQALEDAFGNLPLLVRDVGTWTNYVESWHDALFPDQHLDTLPVTLLDWKRTVAIVKSRMHAVHVADSNGGFRAEFGLVPVADFLNYSPQPNARCYTDRATQAFRCETMRNVARGDEITVAYVDVESPHQLTNHHLLSTYGFTLPFDDKAQDAVEAWRHDISYPIPLPRLAMHAQRWARQGHRCVTQQDVVNVQTQYTHASLRKAQHVAKLHRLCRLWWWANDGCTELRLDSESWFVAWPWVGCHSLA